MTDYTELGKRLVACPHFRWMPGMLVSNGARIVTVNEDTPLRFSGFYPDLSDAATVGCLVILYDESRKMLTVPDPVYTYVAAYGLRHEKTLEELVKRLEAAP